MARLTLWSQTARLVQSAVAYGTAALMTVTLHEFAHGAAALAFGLRPTVYGLHEEDVAGGGWQAAIIAAAGPIASLALGLMFFQIHKRMRGQGFARYLTFWLGLLGIALCMGYLLTPPFFKEGDVYKVLSGMDAATPVFVGLSVLLGGVGFIQVAWIGFPRLLAMTDGSAPLRPQMMASSLLAWLAGSALVLLAMTPRLPWMLVAIGTFAPLMNFFAARRDKAQSYGEPGATPVISWWGIGLLIGLASAEQTVLRWGVVL